MHYSTFAECSLDCQNEGRCAEVDGVYRCLCPEGYTGTNCETDIDECDSNPCVNGTCNDVVNGYDCICSSGYAGINCNGMSRRLCFS